VISRLSGRILREEKRGAVGVLYLDLVMVLIAFFCREKILLMLF